MSGNAPWLQACSSHVALGLRGQGWMVIVNVILSAACDSPDVDSTASRSSRGFTPDAGRGVSPARSATSGAIGPDAGPFGFQRDIYPIFVAECGRCHSVNGPYHDIASPDLVEAYGDAVEFAERVVARIRLGNMPPGCVFDEADCVSSSDFALIERWVAEGMPE